LEGVYGGWLLAIILGFTSSIGYFLHLVDLQGLALAFFIYYTARREKEGIPYMFWQDFWGRRYQHNCLKTGKAFWLVAGPDLPLTRLVRYFNSRSFNLVAVIDAEGRLAGILTETEIMRAIMAGRTRATLIELLAK
jgi:stage IV sporulation protein FB